MSENQEPTEAAADATSPEKDKEDEREVIPPSQEEIIAGFNRLRQEQRGCSNKIAELTEDLGEHKVVINALEGVDEGRRCFRLIGGVLVERTVKEVLPALRNNSEMIEQTCGNLNEALVKKGVQLNEYREKYGIRVQGETPADGGGGGKPSGKEGGDNGEQQKGSVGVLVTDADSATG